MRVFTFVFVCCVFLGILCVVVSIGEREQRHRAEVAEQSADSMAYATVRYHDMADEALRGWTICQTQRDSLAHLADSLRDRRNYWYWRAHTK